MTVEEQVFHILDEQLNVPWDEIRLTHHVQDDLDADSLDVVALLAEIEDHFKIVIPERKIDKFQTVQAIVDYVNAELAKKNVGTTN